MLRITGLTLALLTAISLVPHSAWAWSEQSIPSGHGGSQFTDPDDRLNRMSESSGYGNSDSHTSRFNSQPDGSGFSVSVTQAPAFGMSPFSPMSAPGFGPGFGPGLPDPRR